MRGGLLVTVCEGVACELVVAVSERIVFGFVCLGWWIAHLCLLYVCGLLPFAFCFGWVCMNDDLAC